MKIEKINENQIRCTLNKNDLLERKLKISELAYGTDKAKALFQDMMQQANFEFGFEADDIPLMIEAIPVSKESLILVITKVEDPDELDTRFSKFAPFSSEQSEEENEEDSQDLLQYFSELSDMLAEQPVDTDAEQVLSSESDSSNDVPENTLEPTLLFSFSNLEEVISLSRLIAEKYSAENSLYKNPVSGRYYLRLTKGSIPSEQFVRLEQFVSEYGKRENCIYATQAFLEEHYPVAIEGNALHMLSSL